MTKLAKITNIIMNITSGIFYGLSLLVFFMPLGLLTASLTLTKIVDAFFSPIMQQVALLPYADTIMVAYWLTIIIVLSIVGKLFERNDYENITAQ